LEWKEVEIKGDKPTPRYGHSGTVHGGKWFIFGGYENSLAATCDELWEFSFATSSWTQLKPEGDKPPSRFQHAATLTRRDGDMKLIIFGGNDGAKSLDDLWEYSLSSNKWTQLKLTGQNPTARYGHSCFLSTASYLMIIGGNTDRGNNLFEVNLGTLESKVVAEERAPSSRSNFSIVAQLGVTYLFGGRDSAGKIHGELCKQDLNTGFIELLPKDILISIFKYLTKEDLSALMRQSRKLYSAATDNRVWKSIATSTGAHRYVQKEEENQINIFYKTVNTYILNIDLPPISGGLVWRNPAMWYPSGQKPKPRKFLDPTKWKK